VGGVRPNGNFFCSVWGPLLRSRNQTQSHGPDRSIIEKRNKIKMLALTMADLAFSLRDQHKWVRGLASPHGGRRKENTCRLGKEGDRG
jgi:hypothetical protein